MKKIVLTLTSILLCLSLSAAGKDFKTFTVLEKGEVMLGASASYTTLQFDNSNMFQVIKQLGAKGSIGKIAPEIAFAYADNQAIGLKAGYTSANIDLSKINLNLLSDDLSFNLEDAAVDYRTWSAGLFHRTYFGLEKSGTVGLFCEFSLNYSNTNTKVGLGGPSNNYNVTHKATIGFAPGLIVYIVPFVSLQASVGLANIGYDITQVVKDGTTTGTYTHFAAAANLNLLALGFGVFYHF